MSYRVTKRASEHRKKMSVWRAAKERKRLEGPAPEYPRKLPELRRVIFVVDLDFGMEVHRIDLYRTNRVDCYRAVADGQEWKRRIGWSSVLAGLRKSLPRVAADRG